jgi:general secretion pathway protein A
MVLDYYKLQEQPFGVTPDARYLFPTRTHREALAGLLYGVDSGCGVLALIAAPGLGKTTLLFHALHQMRERARTIFLFKTVSTPRDLMRSLLAGLGLQEVEGSLGELQIRLKEALLEQAREGKRVVLALDEAQNLDAAVLEAVRMLSNFETPREKLIQIILAGQPQLADKLSSPELEMLRQRVSIFCYLKPLSHEETELYIAHRLRIAGYAGETPLVSREALGMIADCSNGVPRTINNLCSNMLALGCVLKRNPLDEGVLKNVLEDLQRRRRQKQPPVLEAQIPASRSAWQTPSLSLSNETIARWLNWSSWVGWTPKFALGLAAILVAAALYLGGHRQFPAKTAAVHAATVSTATSAADSSQPSQSPSAVRMVTVKPGETLFAICLATFGRCDTERLQDLRKLNAGLGNPDHIEVGQQIRIPAWESLPQVEDLQEETP